ncbi:MAG: VWA domain-containing protein [Pirellulaceae bacterium]
MFGLELRDPWFLLLLPLMLPAYWLANRSVSQVAYSSLELFSDAPKSLRMRLAILPGLLLALGVATLIVSLARPRTPERETRVSREGIAVMMIMDLSSSMNARDLVEGDYNVNRLDVVKEVFTSFVLGNSKNSLGGRQDDLVGLVTFAGYADSVCPLTLDHGNLAAIVSDLKIVEVQSEDGTAVGDGLGLAVERLRRSEAKSRIAILLTDGVNNAGVIDPVKAAELAAEFDIKVYCIGAGTNGVAPMPSMDLFGRTQMVGQQVQIDEDTLKAIAEKTDGRYFRAVNRKGLADIYASIDELEKTEVSETRYQRYHEHFAWFLSAGMGLLLVGALLRDSVFRRLP